MTLIVFQKTEDRLLVSGDMKMQWDESLQEPPQIEGWRVKVVVVTERLLVAWAGELVYANNAFLEIWSNRNALSYDDIVDICLKYNNESNITENETDFLVCESTGKACKIAGGTKVDISNDPMNYIGDESLYMDFLSNQNKCDESYLGRFFLSIIRLGNPDCSEEKNGVAKLINRMLNSSELYKKGSNLGHCITCVSCSKEGEFKYHMNMLIDTPHKPPKKKDAWEIVSLGSIEMGSYSFQIVPWKTLEHQIVVYENLYAKRKYIFGDFSEGVPKYCKDSLRVPD